MKVDEIISIVCLNPSDTFTWEEWQKLLHKEGLIVVEDNSPYDIEKVLKATEIREIITKWCEIRLKTPNVELTNSVESSTLRVTQKGEMTVEEWRYRYDQASRNPPINQFIRAKTGPIRVEIELNPGKPPFIFTRTFLQNIVGTEPIWFAQSQDENNPYGWKVILLPKSRDEVIKRLGIIKNIVFVDTIHIIKASESGRSLLGEVVKW